MAKLKATSETAIPISILTANLLKLLEDGKASSRQLHNPKEFPVFMTVSVIHEVEEALDSSAWLIRSESPVLRTYLKAIS